MDLVLYSQQVELHKKSEIEKVVIIFYFYFKTLGQKSFLFSEVSGWFHQLNFAQPNMSRLKVNIKKSSKFINGKIKDSYTLHAKELAKLENELLINGSFHQKISINYYEVLPQNTYRGTRGYLEKLSDQINAAYENNIYDGCAVLMRRLLEILLIHSYENNGITQAIQTSNGDYKLLNEITEDAKNNKTLQLSRNTKEHLDYFRKLGNFSAHKIHYNCKKEDIDRVILDYRACIEELLYKSGIQK